MGLLPRSISTCLATIGVAFLSAVTSVAALFYFIKKEGQYIMADMGTKEAADLWGVSQKQVQEFCRKNVTKDERITQDKKGSPYHIPKDYPNPFAQMR